MFIKEAITEDVANNMIALTLYLDSLDQKRIYYWLNVPGGDVSWAAGWPGHSVAWSGVAGMPTGAWLRIEPAGPGICWSWAEDCKLGRIGGTTKGTLEARS